MRAALCFDTRQRDMRDRYAFAEHFDIRQLVSEACSISTRDAFDFAPPPLVHALAYYHFTVFAFTPLT